MPPRPEPQVGIYDLPHGACGQLAPGRSLHHDRHNDGGDGDDDGDGHGDCDDDDDVDVDVDDGDGDGDDDDDGVVVVDDDDDVHGAGNGVKHDIGQGGCFDWRGTRRRRMRRRRWREADNSDDFAGGCVLLFVSLGQNVLRSFACCSGVSPPKTGQTAGSVGCKFCVAAGGLQV